MERRMDIERRMSEGEREAHASARAESKLFLSSSLSRSLEMASFREKDVFFSSFSWPAITILRIVSVSIAIIVTACILIVN